MAFRTSAYSSRVRKTGSRLVRVRGSRTPFWATREDLRAGLVLNLAARHSGGQGDLEHHVDVLDVVAGTRQRVEPELDVLGRQFVDSEFCRASAQM